MKRLSIISLAIFLLVTAYTSAGGSVRLDGFGDGVRYPQTLGEQWDAPGVTIMAWVYLVHSQGAAEVAVLTIRGAGILFLKDTKLYLYTGDSQVWSNSTPIPVGEWHHFALVRDSGNVWRTYLDGVPDIFAQNLVTPTDNPRPYFGNDQYTDWLDARFAAGKIWTATLTQAEIQAEMGSYSAVRTANIWSVVPMHVHTDLTDQSGQGNTPEATGTLSTEADPPIGSNAALSGHLTYADTGTPGKNVTMTLTAPSFPTQTTTTDVNGNYTFASVPIGNNYTVTPSKTGAANGIESLDASDTARYVAGLSVPSTNQRIASDADGDGVLTSFDASLIARFVVGLPNAGNVGTWKFVPSSRFYPALSGNQTSQNFTAILVGDTGGNWIPSLPAMAFIVSSKFRPRFH